MDSLINAIIYVTSFLAMLSILVFVHEWGHFIVARMNGVRVDVFSIGFGPEIWGRTDKKGTRWKISYVPLGGYIKFFGDASAASTPGGDLDGMSEEDREVSFHHKKLHQRAAIVFAGPLANFIFAILILATFFYAYGQVDTPAIVSQVVEGSAAEQAGMQPGDVIVAVNGSEVKRFKDVRIEVLYSAGESVDFDVLRGGVVVSLTLTPRLTKIVRDGVPVLGDDGKQLELYQIGVQNVEKVVIREHNIGSAIWAGVLETRVIVVQSLRGIRQMIVGTRSVKELSGPIGIAKIAGESAKRGIDFWIRVMALISISLGMINLFPIPLLDGGHLLFYGFEAVLGRKLSERTQEFGFRIGLVFILGLMLMATFNDILKFNW
ncbi:Intramembrane protease RasP/YluC, implicated in cell division based on FtsL cleavage [hydrothermal vent metagenome]|uniref:Intramembrane protease RasP/YluC, implicated in cell division based on FtsL cleavage n=1 Tax=hydrothermal vent metagenome TaxID=652676 RepID=A0A3B0SN71_9ZZZZ